MPESYSYPLADDPAPTAAQDDAATTTALPNEAPFTVGKGLLLPFRRNQRDDFANGSLREFWQSNVELLLSIEGPTETSTGEIPWRPDEGAELRKLRHKNNTSILRAMAEAYIRRAFQRSFPGVLRLTKVDKFRPEPGKLQLEVTFEVVGADGPVIRDAVVEVTIPTE